MVFKLHKMRHSDHSKSGRSAHRGRHGNNSHKSVCKYVGPRKIGSLCRFSLIFVLVLALYITSSYVLNNSDGETSLETVNDTGFTEVENKLYKPQTSTDLSKPVISEVILLPPSVKYGELLPNCGLPRPCPNGEFSIHIYTGKDHKDEPRLCIDGKYILSRNVNGAGRGINAVVVDNMTRTVVKVSHFDTYEKESTALETLLLTLRPGDILILLTFDEPTRKLSRVARLLLYELGSSLIQNLSYRGSWYLVTQKGIAGFTPYEALHVVESSGWPRHHDVHFCVPFFIHGHPIYPDPLPRTNPPRVEFCQKYGNYPVFCDADVINDPLYPAAMMKHSTPVSRIFNTPIVVMSGENVSYLPVTLETLVKQSGINPSLVVIFYLPHHVQVPKLCDLFGFMSVELTQTFNYCERVKEAFETANLLFPDAKEMILLGENIVLSPDFLYYMGQSLPLLQMDPTVLSISAFNENGYQAYAEDLPVLYRVESFSGLAVLVRKDFFQKTWCSNDSDTDPLYISNEIKGESVVPEISRVLAIPLKFSEDYNSSLWSALLSHKRSVTYEDSTLLADVDRMTQNSYKEYLSQLISYAKPLVVGPILDHPCDLVLDNEYSKKSEEFITLVNVNTTGGSYALYVHQANSDDVNAFQFVCRCFGLFYYPSYTPRGLYQNVLRFTWRKNRMFVVGSASPFYHHKPPNVDPLMLRTNYDVV